MSDRLYPATLERLLSWILAEEKTGSIFGFSKELFFTPGPEDPFRMERYGQTLETPIGVAAGPHTQLSQNIVLAWLMGARTLELKTVQTLDELDISKPCIDMADEGYNCEWSQELRLTQSFDEYLNAWILIHVLKDHLFPDSGQDMGCLFNLSVGYDFAGIQQPNVQEFLNRMEDCSPYLDAKLDRIERLYPRIKDISIPTRISDNLTLSTMHGCPPDEVERIAGYFLRDRHYHTAVKLNPTLLGPDGVRNILHGHLGFKDVVVPDEAFEHDMQYEDTCGMIRRLDALAKQEGVQFGLKLTNTLEVENRRDVFPKDETHMYLSGRALHPISVSLAKRLQEEFDGHLDISFSAGADYFNVADLLACNLRPITTCTDVLKPGGYGRLGQYLDEIRSRFTEAGVTTIDDWIFSQAGESTSLAQAGLKNLTTYAEATLSNPRYHHSPRPFSTIKTDRPLTLFDCVSAPCIEGCATDQAIPDYLYYTAQGEFQKALEVILDTNPLPGITGHVCDHLCQLKCTRNTMDQPLLIREIKRFITEQTQFTPRKRPGNSTSVAIIGAGPMGLSCGYFLALNGVEVDIYEAQAKAGGMVSRGIPQFRLTDDAVEADLRRLRELGVRIHLNAPVDAEQFQELQATYKAVVLAAGAQRMKALHIPGEDLAGVMDPLDFLSAVRNGHYPEIGKQVAIIGGGNTAMDAARTAKRLIGAAGEVTLVYRRTQDQMPADFEEVTAALEEGIHLMTLVQPVRIVQASSGKLDIQLQVMTLGAPDASGRPRPVPLEGQWNHLEVDTLIPAIGQEVVTDFLPNGALEFNPHSGETSLPRVYAGGDFSRGASTVINAIGDGRRAAFQILRSLGLGEPSQIPPEKKYAHQTESQLKYARRIPGIPVPEQSPNQRLNFDLVHPTLTVNQAQEEASRCLYCDQVCNICVTVCPNLANLSFDVQPLEEPKMILVPKEDGYDCQTTGTLSITQSSQILNLAEFCNECGNCTTFCPTNGDPYKTKPRFYLTREAFEQEQDGYFLTTDRIEKNIHGHTSTVFLQDGHFFYKGPNGSAQFTLNPLTIHDVRFQSEETPLALEEAVELAFYLKSLNSHPLFQ